MSFGFPAYHQEDVAFPVAITHDWVVYACQAGAFGMAQWAPYVNGWRVSPSVSLWSWGETMTLTLLAPNALRIRSECALPTQCFDWGKNKRNVQRLVQIMWAGVQQSPQLPFLPSRG